MAVPFHIPSLPKPQNQYNFHVDNTNTPYTHPRLPKYGSRTIHPATAFDPLEFAFKPFGAPVSPSKPAPIESTPFKFIETVNDLRYLATKLSESSEFAVDLEHNVYRSFQGMTCLMQISTRREDFVVDTLKLREHIGDYLGEFFREASKRKVMHGASNDVLWLQRDFGIYVCNLFDTMQASRVMKLERNSLDFLLKYYCGVTANKEYQTSDWRLRPLPYTMLKYARGDTHYLLYIYDMMFKNLNSENAQNEYEYDNPLGQVYFKSYEVCTQLYKKELFNYETSYLNLYGLSEANLDAKQLEIVAMLCEWRDRIARKEDESTGYVLPNKLILEIARRLPLTQEDFLELVGYNNNYIIRYAARIVEAIRVLFHRRGDCVMFQDVAKKLKNKVPVSEVAATIIQQKERCNSQVVKRFPAGHLMAMNSNYRRFNRRVCFQPTFAVPCYAYQVVPVVPGYVMY